MSDPQQLRIFPSASPSHAPLLSLALPSRVRSFFYSFPHHHSSAHKDDDDLAYGDFDPRTFASAPHRDSEEDDLAYGESYMTPQPHPKLERIDYLMISRPIGSSHFPAADDSGWESATESSYHTDNSGSDTDAGLIYGRTPPPPARSEWALSLATTRRSDAGLIYGRTLPPPARPEWASSLATARRPGFADAGASSTILHLLRKHGKWIATLAIQCGSIYGNLSRLMTLTDSRIGSTRGHGGQNIRGFASEPEYRGSAWTGKRVSDKSEAFAMPPQATEGRAASKTEGEEEQTLSVADLSQLPEELQLDLHLVEGHGPDDPHCWTCTPPEEEQHYHIPLKIQGHPVVIPVRSTYPLMALSIPPPDPHPRIVLPVAELSDETAEAIFATFPDATGFYLLINGLLQLMVPDHFDYETKLPALPREFGGLKVSFIAQSLYPTANSTVTATSVTSGEQKEGGVAVSQQPLATRYDSVTNTFRSLHGGTVRAIVDSSRDKDRRFDGRIGVFVSPHFDPTQLYATAPTHIFTDAVAASKTISLNSGDWTRAIRPTLVPTGKYQLGEIARVYDPSPQTFPLGFAHDISLVKVTQVHMPLTTTPTTTTTTTTPSLTWMDRREWADIKYNSRNLALLQSGHDVEEAKSIGIVESRCQMVGQGIFRLQQQSRRRRLFGSSGIPNNGASRDELDGWTSLVARSILFRVRQDGAGAPRGSTTRSGDACQSGTPVCVIREDGTLPGTIKIAGFASFAQPVSDVQRYELEGDKLYKRLQEGRVAFYGAFQVPTELREGYKIV